MAAGYVLRVIFPIFQMREDGRQGRTAGCLDQAQFRQRQVFHNSGDLKIGISQLTSHCQVGVNAPGRVFPAAAF